MKVKIRKFRKEDAIKAGNVVKRAQRVTLKKVYSKKLIEAFCKRNNPKHFLERAKERQFYVAETGDKNKKIIGVIALSKNQVMTFYVNPFCQGRGIGRLLFERVKQNALKQKHKKIFVHSSLYAEPIYKALGFRRVKKLRQSFQGMHFYDVLMEQKIK